MDKQVYLYTLPFCPRCNVLKRKLEQAGVEFTELDGKEHSDFLHTDVFPVLETLNGIRYSFEEAIGWLSSLEGEIK